MNVLKIKYDLNTTLQSINKNLEFRFYLKIRINYRI